MNLSGVPSVNTYSALNRNAGDLQNVSGVQNINFDGVAFTLQNVNIDGVAHYVNVGDLQNISGVQNVNFDSVAIAIQNVNMTVLRTT